MPRSFLLLSGWHSGWQCWQSPNVVWVWHTSRGPFLPLYSRKAYCQQPSLTPRLTRCKRPSSPTKLGTVVTNETMKLLPINWQSCWGFTRLGNTTVDIARAHTHTDRQTAMYYKVQVLTHLLLSLSFVKLLRAPREKTHNHPSVADDSLECTQSFRINFEILESPATGGSWRQL